MPVATEILRGESAFQRLFRRLGLALATGVVAGLAAAALEAGLHWGAEALIGRVTELGGGETFVFRSELLWLPALGGLFSGVLLLLLAPSARGHGTDQLVAAFHHRNGQLPLRGPLVKASAAVGVISTGGSAGPEGPIAALGAALGATAGRFWSVTPHERRVLLLSGCAAGVGAIFGCPLGGALFATSVLYREPEFEGSALVSAFLASVVGYSVYASIWGYGNRVLANTGDLQFAGIENLPVHALLGIACGATAVVFAVVVKRTEHLFARASRAPIWLRPALGGVLTGLVACAFPQVMDGQYRTVQNALDGTLFANVASGADWGRWAAILAAIALAKCVATAFTVGSGASGGLLGPAVFIGGIVGAALGAGLMAIDAAAYGDLRPALVPVGMAGVLSAALRTPLAAMVMVMEMTGSFGLIVPLMLVTMTAYVIGRRFGIIDDQVYTAAHSPAHAGDLTVHLLEQRRVADVMHRAWPLRVARDAPLPALLGALHPELPPIVAVVEHDRLLGTVSVAELRHLLDPSDLPPVVIAADLMADPPFLLGPDASLYQAATVFRESGLDAVPVVERDAQGREQWLGMLTRGAVFEIVRGTLGDMRRSLLDEHAGLAAIEEQGTVEHWLGALTLPEGGRLSRLAVGPDLLGRSLAELDFRNARREEVLAIHTRSGDFVCPPDPRRALESGDVLLVVGAANGAEGSA